MIEQTIRQTAARRLPDRRLPDGARHARPGRAAREPAAHDPQPARAARADRGRQAARTRASLAASLPETEGEEPVDGGRGARDPRPLGGRPARAQPRAAAHARLRRLRVRRLPRAARRPRVQGGPGDRRRAGAARRPGGDADRPPEGQHHRRDDGAQLRHARARRLPQGHAPDALRREVRHPGRHARGHRRAPTPGIGAEERGQSNAIAESIMLHVAAAGAHASRS